MEDYFLADYPRTLFPLTTTSLLVEKFSTEIKDVLYNGVLCKTSASSGFLVQQRCYSAKRGYNLRRTVKLDPVAEFFIYDIVFRNRKSFRSDHRSSRKSFGYRFSSGRPESASDAYAVYKTALAGARSDYPLTLKADVATYFNSIYHHDLVATVSEIGWVATDCDALGQFLRESNAGRSVDCLPHGIHPCKALGSEFLRFVDNSYRLRSSLGIRFQHDIHFFDTSEGTLLSDLVTLQELLGERGLSLNDSKTELGPIADVDLPKQIDEMKRTLLKIRRKILVVSGEEVEYESSVQVPLNSDQVDYLLHLLGTAEIEESDAELVLVLLRDHAEAVFSKMLNVLAKFPGLTKNLYHYARLASDPSGLDDLVENFLRDSANATEYQLFWLSKIAEDFLSKSPKLGDILTKIFEHPKATMLSRAKILEIPDRRFGLPERREEVLRSARSDWEAWAAAAGVRCQSSASRNHLLTYFGKGSPLNSLVAECVQHLP